MKTPTLLKLIQLYWSNALIVKVKEDAIKEAKKNFGYFALVSNEIKIANLALCLYRNKDVVEKAFGNLKERLNCRRFLVSSEASLNGKLFTEFVALILLSYIHKQMQEKELYKDVRLASIREGRPDDQFITDKFIAHTEPVWFRLNSRRGPSERIPNFQIARVEASIGNGTVQVACNAAGTVTGYASAILQGGSGILDFTAHERSFGDVPELLRSTAARFHQLFDTELFFYASPADTEKRTAIRAAGAELAGKTPNMEIWYI